LPSTLLLIRLLPTLRADVTRQSQSDRMTLSVVCCDRMTLLITASYCHNRWRWQRHL